MRIITPFVARAVLGTAVVALALTGCSSQAGGDAAGTSGETRSIETIYGTVDVPKTPKRIVAIGFTEATTLADLGIAPVGRTNYIPPLEAYDSFFKDIPVVEDANATPDLEKIASLKPDLIIGSEFADKADKAAFAKLSSIAPTAIFEWKPAAANWENEAQSTAEAVGKTAELDTLKASYAEKAADIKATYADYLSTHTIDALSGDTDNWYLDGPSSAPGRVLTDAGARLNAGADQKDGYVQYSPEQYGLLADTDLIFVSADTTDDATPVTSNAVFGATRAAVNGHVIQSGHFYSGSYAMAEALLDDLQAALAKVQG
ncbi:MULTISPECIES: ABC transporter substrate-binding protein [unclassified Plantibacter]|uniref:ABC transporter substrate-binding protein n=1 Tax=unclassified Plantibacter TaxID=2624265 RepID=UPI003D3461CE